jgi:3-(3-hydroxy-phenyl)propionate hydroxylase
MTHQVDVLVVGAGPVGVSLALLLAHQGVSVIAADRADEIYPLPRAAHIDHEIMRVFQALGLGDEIAKVSRVTADYDFLSASGELLMRFGHGDRLGPGGWPSANMIHQPSVEAELRKALAAIAPRALKTGWELTSYERNAGGVLTRFATATGEETVQARYLVGCDGARSKVRELEAISLHDLDFDEPWLVVDVIVDDPDRLPRSNLQICDPKRPTTCVLMGSGRHRWEFMLKPDETPEAAQDPAFVLELLKPWKVDGAVRLERTAVYRFHALIAQDWRRDVVFLAGDAAHQTPPFAGQGLCAGVRDAANLSWKLAAVLRGEASDSLLDTYQTEREPHARFLIDLALMMGRTVCILDPAAASARDAAMLAQRASGEAPAGPLGAPPFTSGCIKPNDPSAGSYFPQAWSRAETGLARLDDVLAPGAWLISREAAFEAPGLQGFSLADPALAPFAKGLTQWLDTQGAQAVLVRPDRYVFGCGEAKALAADWRAAHH